MNNEFNVKVQWKSNPLLLSSRFPDPTSTTRPALASLGLSKGCLSSTSLLQAKATTTTTKWPCTLQADRWRRRGANKTPWFHNTAQLAECPWPKLSDVRSQCYFAPKIVPHLDLKAPLRHQSPCMWLYHCQDLTEIIRLFCLIPDNRMQTSGGEGRISLFHSFLFFAR